MGKGPKDHRTAARSNRKGSTVAAAAPRATVQVVVEARTPVETASTGSKEGQLGVAAACCTAVGVTLASDRNLQQRDKLLAKKVRCYCTAQARYQLMST